jgi:CRISPR-associated protein Csb1
MGFGSVPATAIPRAAVISGATQTSVLSCSGLRHLQFPDAQGKVDPRRDQAARALLAAWTLYGLVAQNETGYLLRSRCELLPRDAGRIGRTLQERQEVSLQANTALDLLDAAWRHARECGLALLEAPLKLAADDRLVELVRRSRAAVAQGDGADEE